MPARVTIESCNLKTFRARTSSQRVYKVKSGLMETLRILVVSLGLSYAALAVFALIFAERMIFPRPASSYRDNDQIIKLPLDNGEVFSALYLPNPEAKFTLLYSHGNGEDIGHLLPLLELYHQFGFAVFAYDYPGYGTSEGRPTVKNTYEAIIAAYEFLTDDLEIPPANIIAYGRSVGAGPSVHLADRRTLGGLILENAFVSAFRVMTKIPILPWDKYNNIKILPSIECPLLVIHGTADEVIAFWHGQALFERANSPKQYFWVQGGGHNNLIDFSGKVYWDTLENFTKGLEK